MILGIRLSPLALVRFGALAILAGCSSSAGSYSSVPPAQGLQRSITPDNYFNRLYIADATAKLDILDNSFNWLNAIYGTTPCPSGAWINRTGPARLYVADFGCNGQIGVTEYKSLASPPLYATPWFTYSTSLVDPIDVTTDNANDVIVADNGGSAVVEYAQASHTVLHHCTIPYAVGVAVDANGDVFVSELQPMQIVEYPGPAALTNCSAGVPIGATFPSGSAGGGLLVDNSNNLIACDQYDGIYKIAAPSYNVAVQIPTTAAFRCLHLSLNGAGNHLFITEPFIPTPDIQIIKYPNGMVLPPLLPNSANHYIDPVGVAAFPG